MTTPSTRIERIPLPCPACGKATDRLKSYRMPRIFIFAFVAGLAQHATYTACPSCMRRVVIERFAINLIPANVAMFFLGPLYLVHFLRTFRSGHSHEIRRRLRSSAANPAMQRAV